MTTARTLLTDYATTTRNTLTDTGPELDNRLDLGKLIVELQGLLEERNKIDSKNGSTRSKAGKALWRDKFAEVDR